jgi:O-acetyl-ADP-ribose deacetylase (regulator of RNase III)
MDAHALRVESAASAFRMSSPSRALVVRVVVDDLAFFDGDAIARPVTADFGATTSLLRRLELAGGPKLQSQLRLSESLAVGSAVVTGAGDLAAELMVHAVVSSDEQRATAAIVGRATESALQRAADFQVERIGFAPFGLGAGNLDIEASAEAMADALRRHAARASLPDEVVFVAESEDEALAFRSALARAGLRVEAAR